MKPHITRYIPLQAQRGTTQQHRLLLRAARAGLRARLHSSVLYTEDAPLTTAPAMQHTADYATTSLCSPAAQHYLRVFMRHKRTLPLIHCVVILALQRQYMPLSLVKPLLWRLQMYQEYSCYIYAVIGARGRQSAHGAKAHTLAWIADYDVEQASADIARDVRRYRYLKATFENPALNLTSYDHLKMMTTRLWSPVLCRAFLLARERRQWQRYYPTLDEKHPIEWLVHHRYLAALCDASITPPNTGDDFALHKAMYDSIVTEEIAR